MVLYFYNRVSSAIETILEGIREEVKHQRKGAMVILVTEDGGLTLSWGWQY